MCGVNSQEMRSLIVEAIEGNGNAVKSNDDNNTDGYVITVDGILTEDAKAAVVDLIDEDYLSEVDGNSVITVE